MESASEGYAQTVRILLEKGAKENASDHVGWTALFWATFSRRTETLSVLASRGANLNARDGEGRTALFWAASSGYTDMALTLIDRGARVNTKDNYGWTALMTAVDLGHVDTVKALFQRGADAHAKAKDGTTPMRLAEKYRYDEITNLLAKSPPMAESARSDSAAETSDISAERATHGKKSAASSGNQPPQPQSMPLQTSINPPSAGELLNQKLQQAAEAGDTAEVLSLIGRGGQRARRQIWQHRSDGGCGSRAHNTVSALIEKGGEVDATDNAARTALMEAAFEGYTDTVRLLLEKGANTNARDHEGWTALFWATFSRRTATVRLLLDNGADVNSPNKHQDTPLFHASDGGDTDTAVVLLEHHADVNHKDDMGRTPLIEAARQGHADTVRMLLEHGADEKIAAKDGSTALSLAEKLHNTTIVARLKNAPRTPSPAPPQLKPATGETPPADPVATVDTSAPPQATAPRDPLATAAQNLQRQKRYKAFYRIGLSMRLIEEYWTQPGCVAERAAASVLSDLTNVSAPQDLIDLSQQAAARLSSSPDDRKNAIPAVITELHGKLNQYCLSLPDEQFFYSTGTFTYDVSRFGQDLTRAQTFGESSEATRLNLLPRANSVVTQCTYFVDCKEAAASFFAEVVDTLSRTPFGAGDGKALVKVGDEIGVSLGSDEE